MALQPLWTLATFSVSYSIHSLDGGSAHCKAAIYTQNKRRQTSMPQVGFEPTIPVFKRVKTVHALDHTAAVIGSYHIYNYKSLKQ
jgi:hypothetical protein